MSRAATTIDKSNVPETTAMKDFLALIKIGIVNSNLITVFTGMWLAFILNDIPFLANFNTIVLTLIGSALIIAGSASLNNYIDRDIDPLMERTKTRPTVTGKISYSKVLTLGLALVIIGSALLFMTTFTAGVIGVIGILSYVVIYTMWSKRRHVSNTIVGSISGAVPPLIGWAAVDPTLDVLPWMLFLIMFIWQPPHFYALAMKRADEYGKAGIPMLPTVKGFAVTKRHMFVWTLLLLPLPFFMTELGMAFIILATLLNAGWAVLAATGFRTKDDLKWAKYMFIYSLQYLTIIFVAMVIVTVI
ncbi:heme o synthase [Domibacillus indicus]|uniref:heme o synthase n=1 Tax=Domibacillus indicus TaxID=1437523 RepID=UPI000618210E|nr:heme o synthase [Domibacillus indicus]